jgi:predicted secreted protein
MGLAGALVSCAQLSGPPHGEVIGGVAPAQSSRGVSLLGRFVGVLPCADCAGIRTEVRLYAEQPSGLPTRYESTETYLGTRDGDRTVERAGRWTILRGSATDRDATVYQLDFDRPEARRNFLRVGDAELRLLDREEREIASGVPHFLRREPEKARTEPLVLVERDAGPLIEVASGQTIVIRLGSNRSTGYRWTLASSSDRALTPIGEPLYSAGGGVGAGGVEAWSFLATQQGQHELRFEYRRPWEPMAAPAKSLTYEIAVR